LAANNQARAARTAARGTGGGRTSDSSQYDWRRCASAREVFGRARRGFFRRLARSTPTQAAEGTFVRRNSIFGAIREIRQQPQVVFFAA